MPFPLFLVALLACREDTLITVPLPDPPTPAELLVDARFEASILPEDLGRYAWRSIELTVPRGAILFDVEVQLGRGDLDVVVEGPDGEEPACALSAWNGARCTMEEPTPGAWAMHLTTSDGAEQAGLTWNLIGVPAEPFVLARTSVSGAVNVDFQVPDILGDLDVGLEGVNTTLTPVAGGECDDFGCDVPFPAPGPLALEAKADEAMLELVWSPGQEVFFETVDGKVERQITTPLRVAEARGPDGVEISVVIDGNPACTGVGRCRIPAPVPGTWEVATSVPADIRIAGLLAAPPTPPPPTPPPPPAPDQGDDMFSAQLIEGPGVFEGELTTADHDWFLLDLGGEVHVYTTGSTDTHGTALRGPDDVLVADDDSGSGNNFSLFVAEATAVWIDVRGFSPNTQGEYHLVVERVE